MKRKQASTTLYIIFFFVVFLAFSAFAVDASIIFAQRAKLQNITEQAALAGASWYVQSSDAVAYTEVIFSLLSQDMLEHAECVVTQKPEDKRVLLETSVIAQPIFLSFLGVSGVNLQARACAQSSELDVTAGSSGFVRWLTPSAAYFSNLLTANNSYGDTAILTPLGEFDSASMPIEGATTPNYKLISSGSDTSGLNLGPGGYVTIRLPSPIVNKPGNDLFIKEAGDAKEGYMVFAGLDIDPSDSNDGSVSTGPYVKAGNPGKGIKWTNISCTGTAANIPENSTMIDIPSPTEVDSTTFYTKIYGSANFDLGTTCGGYKPVSMIKYIRIVDDNEETAYIMSNNNFNKHTILGESSTSTAGADISLVQVLNYVTLIPPSSF